MIGALADERQAYYQAKKKEEERDDEGFCVFRNTEHGVERSICRPRLSAYREGDGVALSFSLILMMQSADPAFLGILNGAGWQ